MMSPVFNGYAVGLLRGKSSNFLPTINLVVIDGRAGPPNTAGPRCIAVSATMVVTPLLTIKQGVSRVIVYYIA